MNMKGIFLLLLALVALSACATIPTGPSVMVWPGPEKPFEVFQSDDAVCRQWASQQVGGEPVESANQTLVSGAAVGTMLGAGLGCGDWCCHWRFGCRPWHWCRKWCYYGNRSGKWPLLWSPMGSPETI